LEEIAAGSGYFRLHGHAERDASAYPGQTLAS
jgi:hypothetical protein